MQAAGLFSSQVGQTVVPADLLLARGGSADFSAVLSESIFENFLIPAGESAGISPNCAPSVPSGSDPGGKKVLSKGDRKVQADAPLLPDDPQTSVVPVLLTNPLTPNVPVAIPLLPASLGTVLGASEKPEAAIGNELSRAEQSLVPGRAVAVTTTPALPQSSRSLPLETKIATRTPALPQAKPLLVTGDLSATGNSDLVAIVPGKVEAKSVVDGTRYARVSRLQIPVAETVAPHVIAAVQTTASAVSERFPAAATTVSKSPAIPESRTLGSHQAAHLVSTVTSPPATGSDIASVFTKNQSANVEDAVSIPALKSIVPPGKTIAQASVPVSAAHVPPGKMDAVVLDTHAPEAPPVAEILPKPSSGRSEAEFRATTSAVSVSVGTNATVLRPETKSASRVAVNSIPAPAISTLQQAVADTPSLVAVVPLPSESSAPAAPGPTPAARVDASAAPPPAIRDATPSTVVGVPDASGQTLQTAPVDGVATATSEPVPAAGAKALPPGTDKSKVSVLATTSEIRSAASRALQGRAQIFAESPAVTKAQPRPTRVQAAAESKDDSPKKEAGTSGQGTASAHEPQASPLREDGVTAVVPREATSVAPSHSSSAETREAPNAPQLPDAPPAVDKTLPLARLAADAAGEAQMHVGIRTAAFGAVEIYTSVHQNQVGLTIHGEREIAHWFSSEVQNLESGLKDHHLHLTTMDMDRAGNGLQTSTGSKEQNPEHNFQAMKKWQRYRPPERGKAEPIEVVPVRLAAGLGESRVSIHI